MLVDEAPKLPVEVLGAPDDVISKVIVVLSANIVAASVDVTVGSVSTSTNFLSVKGIELGVDDSPASDVIGLRVTIVFSILINASVVVADSGSVDHDGMSDPVETANGVSEELWF